MQNCFVANFDQCISTSKKFLSIFKESIQNPLKFYPLFFSLKRHCKTLYVCNCKNYILSEENCFAAYFSAWEKLETKYSFRMEYSFLVLAYRCDQASSLGATLKTPHYDSAATHYPPQCHRKIEVYYYGMQFKCLLPLTLRLKKN